ncbi:hypothetical protein HK098_003657 [Nowakowskiella sp. JEL0407]|nr:hypothetical protein HK098_003657 [Nowakowskiella sp. JEL0407]
MSRYFIAIVDALILDGLNVFQECAKTFQLHILEELKKGLWNESNGIPFYLGYNTDKITQTFTENKHFQLLKLVKTKLTECDWINLKWNNENLNFDLVQIDIVLYSRGRSNAVFGDRIIILQPTSPTSSNIEFSENFKPDEYNNHEEDDSDDDKDPEMLPNSYVVFGVTLDMYSSQYISKIAQLERNLCTLLCRQQEATNNPAHAPGNVFALVGLGLRVDKRNRTYTQFFISTFIEKYQTRIPIIYQLFQLMRVGIIYSFHFERNLRKMGSIQVWELLR